MDCAERGWKIFPLYPARQCWQSVGVSTDQKMASQWLTGGFDDAQLLEEIEPVVLRERLHDLAVLEVVDDGPRDVDLRSRRRDPLEFAVVRPPHPVALDDGAITDDAVGDGDGEVGEGAKALLYARTYSLNAARPRIGPAAPGVWTSSSLDAASSRTSSWPLSNASDHTLSNSRSSASVIALAGSHPIPQRFGGHTDTAPAGDVPYVVTSLGHQSTPTNHLDNPWMILRPALHACPWRGPASPSPRRRVRVRSRRGARGGGRASLSDDRGRIPTLLSQWQRDAHSLYT